LETSHKFTLDELRQFDGKNGRPAYVGYKGKVYDVSGSGQWGNGDHMGHEAGRDLTDDMDIAPHAGDVMKRMKIVGDLAATKHWSFFH
jgi:predicted heme/steroid binding protein